MTNRPMHLHGSVCWRDAAWKRESDSSVSRSARGTITVTLRTLIRRAAKPSTGRLPAY